MATSSGGRPAWANALPHGFARAVCSLLAGLALASAAISLVPFRSTIAGVPVVVSASVTPSQRGFTVDSSAGSVQFRSVTDLPIGLHADPHIDLNTVRAATTRAASFGDQAKADLKARLPAMALHFCLLALVGLVVGALAGRLLFDGLSLLVSDHVPAFGGRRRRLRDTATAVLGLAALAAGSCAVALFVSYRPDWATRYSVTGLLADVAATPGQLAALDARDAAAADKIRAVLRLQDALTRPRSSATAPAAAYRILLISDVHRRNIYPYLQRYIDDNDVSLIINTGDETLVGDVRELTADYTASITSITARTPMIWVKGNHDSPAVARAMAALPGVTVLGDQVVEADGLQIYGTPDPRTYGAAGDAGSDDPKVVTRVEGAAAAAALEHLDRSVYLDLLLAHEPVEADVLATTLGPAVHAQASGHLHHQNSEGDLQSSGHSDIRLVEGSTGLGGLLADAGDPMEFSILSVTVNCQFTRLARYALADPSLPASDAFGQSSSLLVHYFSRQQVAPDRRCDAASVSGSRSTRPPPRSTA